MICGFYFLNTGQVNSRSRRPQGSRSAFVIYSRSGSTGGKARPRAKAGTRADSSTAPEETRAAHAAGPRHRKPNGKKTPTQRDRQRARAPAHRTASQGPPAGIPKRGGGGAGTPQTRTQKRAPGLRVNLQPRVQLPAGRQCAWHSPSGWVQTIYRDRVFSYGCDFLLRHQLCKSQCNTCNNAQKRLKIVVFFFFMVYFIIAC